MDAYDPYDLLGRLRDHLSTRDAPLTFLMGAGTSGSVNVAPPPAPGGARGFVPLIPAIVELTKQVRERCIEHDAKYENAWDGLSQACSDRGRSPNIEEILGLLRLTTEAMTPSSSAFTLTAPELTELERAIQQAVTEIASPSVADIPDKLPHGLFAEWIRNADRTHPVEIFTTNYDVLVERSLELAHIPVFDGFVGSYQPFFVPSSVAPPEANGATRIWKLHGSVNWSIGEGGTVRKGATGDGAMILPSHLKYDESRKMPYLALMDRLGQAVARNSSTTFTCGYSWGDQHVNATLLSGLETAPTSAIFALMYGDISETDAVVEYALQHRNLTVVGRNAAVVRGGFAAWERPSATGSSPSGVLAKYVSDDKTSSPPSARVHVGDFNVFADFLDAMSSQRPGRN